MSETVEIVRLGHAGDGVSADGRVFPFTAPGDLIAVEGEHVVGVLTPSPLRTTPPCKHFGACGGCALQHIASPAYLEFKRDLIVQALAQRGFNDVAADETVSVPPRTRGRAALKAKKQNGRIEIGFHARASHAIVDMRECHVLTPKLLAMVGTLRDALVPVLRESEEVELHLTEVDNGIDLTLRWKRRLDARMTAQLAALAAKAGLLRLTCGRELVFQSDAPVLELGDVAVALPPASFLQPTREGEAILQERVADLLGNAKHVADLFCGAGTFALPMAKKIRVHAADGDEAAITALKNAARHATGLKPLTTEQRDLFRRPLEAAELARFDAVVLDPPRAGAAAQAERLAASNVKRVVYVSCNPVSFARDARMLADGGLRLCQVTPVDQFLWSAHIELVALFQR